MRVRRTVLIVDDDALVLAGTAAALEAVGFHVWTTGSGEDAIALFDRIRPDVLVTDLRLPGMDGLSLLDRLAGRAGAVPIRSIIYSAAPPPAPSACPSTVRWIPKAPGHQGLIDVLTGRHQRRARGP